MKKIVVLGITLAFVFLGGTLWWNNGLSAVNPQDKTEKIFIIPQGQGVREIANNLKKQGFIKDPVVFFLLVKRLRLDGKIQAGDFRLSPSQTAQQIAENLTHGTLDIWVTIPEGKRAEEIASILKEKIPSYEPSWEEKLVKQEGYLFPDTYLIPKDADIEMIIMLLTNTFEEKFVSLPPNTSGLTKEQIVILASLIEREAITNEEKPIIAGILLNRLNEGMALQVDATIQYAKGQNATSKKWWEPVTFEEYKSVVSNYNTYLYPGLPPGPIANPGLDALTAAASPSNTDYLYYLHDKTRTIRYAKTIEEHNDNIKKFGLSN